MGLSITEGEAREFAQQMRMAQLEATDKYSKAIQEITFASKGLPEDEYWEASVRGYQRNSSVYKLREQISLEEFVKLGEKLKSEAEIDYLVNISELFYQLTYDMQN